MLKGGGGGGAQKGPTVQNVYVCVGGGGGRETFIISRGEGVHKVSDLGCSHIVAPLSLRNIL